MVFGDSQRPEVSSMAVEVQAVGGALWEVPVADLAAIAMSRRPRMLPTLAHDAQCPTMLIGQAQGLGGSRQTCHHDWNPLSMREGLFHGQQ